MGWKSLKVGSEIFATRLFRALQVLGAESVCVRLNIDHACVRLRDPKDVDSLRETLRKHAREISATEVNGRIISIFELNTPLAFGSWQVTGVEVPYPKPNHRYEDGWEHVEFVLDCKNSMEEVRERFQTLFPHIGSSVKAIYHYEEEQPSSSHDQLPNPTISLSVGDIGIKFHALPIQQVVGYRIS